MLFRVFFFLFLVVLTSLSSRGSRGGSFKNVSSSSSTGVVGGRCRGKFPRVTHESARVGRRRVVTWCACDAPASRRRTTRRCAWDAAAAAGTRGGKLGGPKLRGSVPAARIHNAHTSHLPREPDHDGIEIRARQFRIFSRYYLSSRIFFYRTLLPYIYFV